jgi:glycosyltransferase involved in cell wall biosynthesis
MKRDQPGPALLRVFEPGAARGRGGSQGPSLTRATPPHAGPSVLLVLPDLSGGGAERTSLNVRQQLCEGGRNVKLASLEARGEYLDLVSPDAYVLPRSRLLRALARLCPPDSPQRALLQVPLLMGLLRREAPNVVMPSMADVTLPLALAFAWMPGRRRATRWIAREGSNTRVVIERAFPNPKLRRLAEKLIRWAYRSADVCLAISPGVAQGLVDYYNVDPKRIRVIPNPVDLEGVRAGTATPLTASGCPVVVTDCEYGPADIVRQGENGILVAPDSAEALVTGLKRLLLRPDEAKALAEHALERAKDFSVDTISAADWELFAATEASP